MNDSGEKTHRNSWTGGGARGPCGSLDVGRFTGLSSVNPGLHACRRRRSSAGRQTVSARSQNGVSGGSRGETTLHRHPTLITPAGTPVFRTCPGYVGFQLRRLSFPLASRSHEKGVSPATKSATGPRDESHCAVRTNCTCETPAAGKFAHFRVRRADVTNVDVPDEIGTERANIIFVDVARGALGDSPVCAAPGGSRTFSCVATRSLLSVEVVRDRRRASGSNRVKVRCRGGKYVRGVLRQGHRGRQGSFPCCGTEPRIRGALAYARYATPDVIRDMRAMRAETASPAGTVGCTVFAG